MKLSVSNIAWPAELDREAYGLLADAGVSGLEIAPTRVWPDWSGISDASVKAFRQSVEDAGLRISSLQSVLFQKPELQVFGNTSTEMKDHLRFCAGLAGQLGAGAVVFGSPKNRDRGDLSKTDAMERAAEFFRDVAPAYAAAGTTLCMEANPEVYACNFATHGDEAAELVRAVDHPGFRLHLDTACALLAGDDIGALIRSHADLLMHFHASETQLGSFAAPTSAHDVAARALDEAGYLGWVAIEMRAQEDVLAALRGAVKFVSASYTEVPA